MTSAWTLIDWVGVAAVAVFLLVTLGATHVARHNSAMAPELSRKVMHVALGGSALAFPWIFTTPSPAFVVAGMTILVLLALRTGTLGADARGVVHGVSRKSEGDLYLPVAIALSFAFADGDALVYVIPMLIATFADSAAAVVGTRHGRTRFMTLHHRELKSVEGSLAFAGFAFVVTAAALTLGTRLTPGNIVLVAAVLGLHVTLVEAASCRGLDNLMVPLAGLWLLREYLSWDTRSLTTMLIVTLAFVALALSLHSPLRARVQRDRVLQRAGHLA
jgi:phytol kinase